MLSGAVVGIALEHSSLRAWRFFERAGARGLTDLSSVRPATKISCMTDSSVEEELEIVGWTPATVSPVLVAELSGQTVLV